MDLWKRKKRDKKPFTTVDVAGAVMGMTVGAVNSKVRKYIEHMELVDIPHEKYFLLSSYNKGKTIKLCYGLTETGINHMVKSFRGRAGQQLANAYAEYKGDK